MCSNVPTVEATPPEQTLAEAMKKDLGVDISPQALRLFILARWDRVTVLAHAIHERN